MGHKPQGFKHRFLAWNQLYDWYTHGKTFKLNHENKSCSACPKDQHKQYINKCRYMTCIFFIYRVHKSVNIVVNNNIHN